MATDDPSERLARALPGFHANADDSPREPDAWPADSGPADAGPADAMDPAGITLDPWPRGEAPRRRLPAAARLGLVAAALVVVAGGVVVAATLANRRDEQVAASAGPALQIDASPVAPAPLPQPARDAGKLDVLPDLPPTPIASAPPAQTPAYPEVEEGAGSDAVTTTPPEAAPPPVAEQERAPPARDCADAPTRAEAMICSDPQLAAADRRMRRAYVAALRHGAPPDLLGREQDDWLRARDEAARYSREALADAYRARIAELADIADNGW